MATNTKKGYRKGAVRDRSQFRHPSSGRWVKRGSGGRILDVKSDRSPFKGVRRERGT